MASMFALLYGLILVINSYSISPYKGLELPFGLHQINYDPLKTVLPRTIALNDY